MRSIQNGRSLFYFESAGRSWLQRQIKDDGHFPCIDILLYSAADLWLHEFANCTIFDVVRKIVVCALLAINLEFVAFIAIEIDFFGIIIAVVPTKADAWFTVEIKVLNIVRQYSRYQEDKKLFHIIFGSLIFFTDIDCPNLVGKANALAPSRTTYSPVNNNFPLLKYF